MAALRTSRIRSMVAAYRSKCGGEIKFKRDEYLPKKSMIARLQNGNAVIKYNPYYKAEFLKNQPSAVRIHSERIKARRVAELLIEDKYPLMRCCADPGIPAFIRALNESEEADSVKIIEDEITHNVVFSMERSMTFLQRVVANNIMSTEYNFDIPLEYYHSYSPRYVIDSATDLNDLIARTEKNSRYLSVPHFKRVAVSRALISFAESFIYQGRAAKMAALKEMNISAKETFFEFLRAAGLDVPASKNALLSPDFRKEHYTPEKYLGAVKNTQKFFGNWGNLEVSVGDQIRFDNAIATKALVVIDSICEKPKVEDLNDLVYALDLFLRVQIIDVEKQLQETFALCCKAEELRLPVESREYILANLVLRSMRLEAKSAEYFFVKELRKTARGKKI